MKFFSVLQRIFLQRPTFAALTCALIVTTILLLIVNNEVKRLIGDEQLRTAGHLSVIRAKLESELSDNLSVMRAIRADIAVNRELSADTFMRLAKELLIDTPHVSHLAVAPDLVIKFMYPLKGNEKAIGLDYRNLPEQLEAIQYAIDIEKVVLSPPVQLVQGGTAMIARMPVFLDDDQGDHVFWGVVSEVINYQAMLDNVIKNGQTVGLEIAIRGYSDASNPSDVFYGPPDLFEREVITTEVTAPADIWQVAAVPVDGWHLPAGRLYIMFGGTFLLALFSGVVTYLLSIAYRDKIQAVETATYRANYDVLTGLPNRYYFSLRLDYLIKEVRRTGQDFAIFFIDIDHFKQINDSAGHSIGDELLIEFASRLKQSCRDSDIVARLAGDEFVLVLKNIDDAIQADLLAEKLQGHINKPFMLNNHQHRVTASIGVAMYPADGEDVTKLLLHADQAMYAAKRSGRNSYFFFNEGMQEEANFHLVMHADILRGIEAEEFVLYYQPIKNLSTGVIDKCEVLVRWQHSEKGMVMPDQFISVAERTGAIRELGNWILDKACKDLKVFLDSGIDIRLSVNRSVNEFYSLKAYEAWKGIFVKNAVDSKRFVFEITESLLVEKHEVIVSIVSALRKLGVQFSIDDFGTGYSALNYLRSYPVNYLKIDKSFIQDIEHDAQDRTLVEVIIKMGRALGIEVVAEGVENEDQANCLREFECDYFQGYWLAKPMPLEAIIPFCLEQSELVHDG